VAIREKEERKTKLEQDGGQTCLPSRLFGRLRMPIYSFDHRPCCRVHRRPLGKRRCFLCELRWDNGRGRNGSAALLGMRVVLVVVMAMV
jgi:hypothetical protein